MAKYYLTSPRPLLSIFGAVLLVIAVAGGATFGGNIRMAA